MSKRDKSLSSGKSGGRSRSRTEPLESASVQTPSLENAFSDLRQTIEGRLKRLEDNKQDQSNGILRTLKKTEKLLGKKRKFDESSTTVEPATDKKSKKFDQEDEEQDLEQIVQELGGTKDDLDLIAGADSESELEGFADPQPATKSEGAKKGKSLEAGISNILKEISLARTSGQGDDTTSEPQTVHVDQHVSPAQPVEKTMENPNSKKKNKQHRPSDLNCDPRPDWFNISEPLQLSETQNEDLIVSSQLVEQIFAHARALLKAENEQFAKFQESSSSQAFYNTVIASGTLSDKISALTLAVQESPLHNMRALESLMNLARKRSRAQAVDVLRALKDLFAQGSLLPGDRKLYAFKTQPSLLNALHQIKSWKEGDRLPKGLSVPQLICWAYENWLKDQYFDVLKILEVWSNDEIEFSKARAVSYIYELLKEKPEQESNLLRLLVNKLGDPTKKIASQASYLVMQLLANHPAMKEVVITTIESDFIFRPGQSMHGRYYAAVTLNQTVLSQKEEGLAAKLLDIYFGLFKTLLRNDSRTPHAEDTKQESQTRGQRQRKLKKGPAASELQGSELQDKLISAILTGVNRAHPYTGNDHQSFDVHMDTLFQITHSANFNTGIQAMLLIQQLTSATQSSADRFYRTLYESLLDVRLISSSKQQLYLNLLHRSLKADLNQKRVKAFVKRLIQILSLHEPPFICGAFFLLKDLEKTFPSLSALVDQPEEKDEDEEVFRDVDEDGAEVSSAAGIQHVSSNSYDASKRAPEHANADNSCIWELVPYLAHFHPSVTVGADHILEHTTLPGKPDLSLHTLMHFLDRFVYKNPKLSAVKMRGSSIMQPMANDDRHAVLVNSVKGKKQVPVNSEEFKNRKDQDVAAEDAFFHKYFNALGKSAAGKKSKKSRDQDREGSIESNEEDEVWKAMLDSAPDLEGLDDGDEDDIPMSDLSDFEAAMEEDDDGEDEDMMIDGQHEGGDDEEVDVEAGIFDDESDAESIEKGSEDDRSSDAESEFGGLDSEEDETKQRKRKNTEKRQQDRERRKKLKALPTFASVADYADMLDKEEDEDLG